MAAAKMAVAAANTVAPKTFLDAATSVWTATTAAV